MFFISREFDIGRFLFSLGKKNIDQGMVCSYDIDRKCERVGFCSSSLNPKKTMESTNKRETPKDKISFFIISLEANVVKCFKIDLN